MGGMSGRGHHLERAQQRLQGQGFPGAAYQVPATLDKKAAKIGTSLRPDLSLSLGVDPKGSPGPTYNLRDVPGAMIGDEKVPDAQRDKSFGKAARFSSDARGKSIGPGQYARKDVALNLESGRSIGTGRQAWEKVVTPGWECEGRCRASPGPGDPLWRDIIKEGSRAHHIPVAERFPKPSLGNCAPGPGTYDVTRPEGPRRSASTGSLGRKVPKPVSTFGAKPKKPRFRPLLAQLVAKHGSWGYS